MDKPRTLPADSVGLVDQQTITLFGPPDVLRLECGRTLGPIEVAYETYGQLNARRDNAILLFHALSGDAHAAGVQRGPDQRPGWWEVMIGPGKGIDTNEYFVICANILGGCKGTTGPSSINPATGQPWGLDFPVITIEDMVKVHARLLDGLAIDQVLGVIGGSMGGMQVLEFTRCFPQRTRSAIAIATTARLNAQSIAFDAIGRSAILADANFAGGQYHDGPGPGPGLAIARMVGHVTYLSEEGMHRKFGRQLRHADRYRYDFTSEFSVETYLDHQGRAFVDRFDANSYLYITKAMDYFDLTRGGETLAAAFADVEAAFLVVSFRSDWLFTPAQSRQIVAALLAADKRVSYHDIDSPHGHDAFLLEPEKLGRLIRAHFAAVAGRPLRNGTPAQAAGLEDIAGSLEVAAPTRPGRPRVDHARIEELVPDQARVLDLGCGDGALLARLARSRNVRGLGLEIDDEMVAECVERGLPVIHGDLETELPNLATQSFDVVILSQTLQSLRQPQRVLQELLRVGRVALVSFENCAHWRRRIRLLLRGAVAPRGPDGPAWSDASPARSISLHGFERFCRENGVHIEARIALRGGRDVHWRPNLRAEQAVYVLSAANRAPAPHAGR